MARKKMEEEHEKVSDDSSISKREITSQNKANKDSFILPTIYDQSASYDHSMNVQKHQK